MTNLIALAKECGAATGTLNADVAFSASELAAYTARIRGEALAEAAKAVPTSWLDPLLSGPNSRDLPFAGPDVEHLLHGIAAAIRKLAGGQD